jgi:hypothetical protein
MRMTKITTKRVFWYAFYHSLSKSANSPWQTSVIVSSTLLCDL